MTSVEAFVLLAFFLILTPDCSLLLAEGIHDASKDPARMNYLGSVGAKRFYATDNLTDWHTAIYECSMFGMKPVRLDSVEERAFALSKLEYGPFWFGARDIGKREMYRWVETTNVPTDNADQIGGFLNFYHMVEEGPMALCMHGALGSELFGVHSHKKFAKPFCQLTT